MFAVNIRTEKKKLYSKSSAHLHTVLSLFCFSFGKPIINYNCLYLLSNIPVIKSLQILISLLFFVTATMAQNKKAVETASIGYA